ncbi:hypothetical protein EVAR_76122_1 [Eumeta japonica]|uniref:Uncharacterized protein n=1 Tax=Eumeta variegata TaxID=151549 RepID=A0A4C2AAR2_EUMVA|nr:hypothetical protein EVAR_76122_1 [Eumeta japonica]
MYFFSWRPPSVTSSRIAEAASLKPPIRFPKRCESITRIKLPAAAAATLRRLHSSEPAWSQARRRLRKCDPDKFHHGRKQRARRNDPASAPPAWAHKSISDSGDPSRSRPLEAATARHTCGCAVAATPGRHELSGKDPRTKSWQKPTGDVQPQPSSPSFDAASVFRSTVASTITIYCAAQQRIDSYILYSKSVGSTGQGKIIQSPSVHGIKLSMKREVAERSPLRLAGHGDSKRRLAKIILDSVSKGPKYMRLRTITRQHFVSFANVLGLLKLTTFLWIQEADLRLFLSMLAFVPPLTIQSAQARFSPSTKKGVLSEYPENGSYIVINDIEAGPGDAFDDISLILYTSDEYFALEIVYLA